MLPLSIKSYIHSLTADPYPNPDYSIIRTADDFHSYVHRYTNPSTPANFPLGEDTESYPVWRRDYIDGAGWTQRRITYHHFCLTFSLYPGTGRLIHTHDTHLIDLFRAWAITTNPLHIFHNYLHDVNIYDDLSIPVLDFFDTMVFSYNLCLGGGGDNDGESRAGRGSLGLKSLAKRQCNMDMKSFKDTVYPHSIPHLVQYLSLALPLFLPEDKTLKKCECGCPRHDHISRGTTGKLKGSCTLCKCERYKLGKEKMTEEETRLNRLYRKVNGLIQDIRDGKCEMDYSGDDEEEGGEIMDPWKRMKGWHNYDLEALRLNLGWWPIPSIQHVPEPEMVHYACRDADADLRLYYSLHSLKPWVFYE